MSFADIQLHRKRRDRVEQAWRRRWGCDKSGSWNSVQDSGFGGICAIDAHGCRYGRVACVCAVHALEWVVDVSTSRLSRIRIGDLPAIPPLRTLPLHSYTRTSCTVPVPRRCGRFPNHRNLRTPRSQLPIGVQEFHAQFCLGGRTYCEWRRRRGSEHSECDQSDETRDGW